LVGGETWGFYTTSLPSSLGITFLPGKMMTLREKEEQRFDIFLPNLMLFPFYPPFSWGLRGEEFIFYIVLISKQDPVMHCNRLNHLTPFSAHGDHRRRIKNEE
jgi:hypothetical protein